ncbi:hypothetical protein HNR49_001784 [Halobacterium salinarum]|uniref:Uncharacterized protein n=3 Tax=Halobacterium salinarum TaxID=2242 RepID=A0A510N5J6_HALSA|nr:hypothetical protein [Halobacterium salinarum]CAP13560.1 uncharacterized protein OE_2233F [Halobacterium salinarum R1]DAC77995.1 TPA_inf: uncharacterized protein VNG_0835b [Halobacterium salinarum NRC-1]
MGDVTIGFGLGSVSTRAAAATVAVGSSLLMLVAYIALGRNVIAALSEATLSGIVIGVAYYIGLSVRSVAN